MRHHDHRAPSLAFIAVALVAFIVTATCAAHAVAVSAGWSDPLPGFDPFARHRPAASPHGLDSRPTQAAAPDADAPAQVVHDHAVRRTGARQGQVEPRGRSESQGHAYGHLAAQHPQGHAYGHLAAQHPQGHAYGHLVHQDPQGHAYGWATKSAGRALTKGHTQ